MQQCCGRAEGVSSPVAASFWVSMRADRPQCHQQRQGSSPSAGKGESRRLIECAQTELGAWKEIGEDTRVDSTNRLKPQRTSSFPNRRFPVAVRSPGFGFAVEWALYHRDVGIVAIYYPGCCVAAVAEALCHSARSASCPYSIAPCKFIHWLRAGERIVLALVRSSDDICRAMASRAVRLNGNLGFIKAFLVPTITKSDEPRGENLTDVRR